MSRRIAALFALFAFAAAWLVGVWCGHSSKTRLENASIALAAGLLAGFGVGVALERIVLARLSEEWKEKNESEFSSGIETARNVERSATVVPPARSGPPANVASDVASAVAVDSAVASPSLARVER